MPLKEYDEPLNQIVMALPMLCH